MLKKVFLIWLMAFNVFQVTCFAAENVLKNPGFEELGETLPEGWNQDVWTPGTEATRFGIITQGVHSGKGSVLIENVQPNDAKWVQKVTVKAASLYKLSGWIQMVQVGSAGKGASLSVLGSTESFPEVKEASEAWQFVELYGKTGAKQQELKIAARLGGYGSLNTGKAYFDDIALEEVKTAPSGVKVYSFDEEVIASAASNQEGANEVSTTPFLLYSALFFLFFLAIYLTLIRQNRLSAISSGRLNMGMLVMLLAALILRLILAPTEGYTADMNTFIAWAHHAAALGMSGFYDGSMFADYPPGYIYVLYFLGKISSVMELGLQPKALHVLMKLPAIFADLATTYMIYRLACKRMNPGTAFGLSLLYAFNPAILINSSIWGQVDSFFTFFLLIFFMQLGNGKLEKAGVWFAVAVLIKPQALIFTPVLLFSLLRERSWKRLLFTALSGLVTFVVGIFPFALHKSGLWIVELYKATLASYPYATLNAFNLFALTGANMAPEQQKLLFFTYQTWGIIFIAAIVFGVGFLFLKSKSDSQAKVFFAALLIIAGVFILTSKMHERYLFPAVLLALVSYITIQDRRLLHVFIGFSLTHYVNVSYVLAMSRDQQYTIPRLDGILLITSFVNVMLLLYLIHMGIDILLKERKQPIFKPGKYAMTLAYPETFSKEIPMSESKYVRKDWFLMGALTFIYAVIALINLGSFHAPETSWKPSAVEDSFYVDLGEKKSIDRINSFGGISEGSFKLEFADSPDQWTNPLNVEMNYVKVFTWNSLPVNYTARYVKLTVVNPGFTLNELAIYEKLDDQPLPIKVIHTEGMLHPAVGSESNLFDENSKTVYRPSYLDGTYFDEIYHARTAYEHLHQLTPYENTHPPLGKLLISLGIAVFGMNPFGWRIVGTLFGVAMIPLIYLFAKRLFGKSEYAFLSAFLLSFDFMHFVQTRIATIDVYGVFFIMLMYYFMYRYYMTSFYHISFRRSLMPLLLSGLFFGIGAACKWITLYGGAGLALLFFLSLYERYLEYEAAKSSKQTINRHKLKDHALIEHYNHVIHVFPRYVVKSVAWCGLFFIIIPGIIYSLSFLPILTVPGEPHTVSRLIEYQKNMYDYHSKLKATHAFGSPWYEWPFMVKPIWYYTGQSQVPEGEVSSIVSMGNPAVWWIGILAVIAAIFIVRKRKDKGMFVVLVAFFSQYVPWMLVTRLTFIYHFFAMVPFMVLCITYVLKDKIETNPVWKKWTYAYMGVVLGLFAMFYPILSGAVVSKWYVSHFLSWFRSWYFYS